MQKDMPSDCLRRVLWVLMVALLGIDVDSCTAQPTESRRPVVAPKPVFRDPVFDGAADPEIIWNFAENKWFMFYTNRRAKLPDAEVHGVDWVHGTKIGIAESTDGAHWTYRGTANIDHGGPEATYWAPEVVFGFGQYHMYLTVVPGVFTDWNHPRSIVHLTSRDLLNWKYESTLQLATDRVIDACVQQLADGTHRLWYNNEKDRKSIYFADSVDLAQWQDRGKVDMAGQQAGEGPQVFHWRNSYWMIVDVWNGLAVYKSADATKWERQPDNLLQQPGTGTDDGVIGQHPGVLLTGRRAYLYYFTHPGRVPDPPKTPDAGYQSRRSSIQVVELKFQDDWLTCDRNAEVRINARWQPPIRVHDPSTILKEGDRYWCFSTGTGIQSTYSTDLVHWHQSRPVFTELPAWVQKEVPGHWGHLWAPDVIRWGDRYLMYYSVSIFGKQTSVIALASARSLDPASADYGWTDHGVVVKTDESSDHNAIDPSVIATADGKLWLAYGSYWTGIKLIELDSKTGLRIAPDSPTYSLAHKQEIEAACLHFHDGYYYLFVNWGTCCRGVRSTYNIRVGRSREITGPYVDRDGVDLLKGGGTLALGNQENRIGPGHAGFLEVDGQPLFAYHYYDANRRGTARLGINRLSWDAEGWPIVEAALAYEAGLDAAAE